MRNEVLRWSHERRERVCLPGSRVWWIPPALTGLLECWTSRAQPAWVLGHHQAGLMGSVRLSHAAEWHHLAVPISHTWGFCEGLLKPTGCYSNWKGHPGLGLLFKPMPERLWGITGSSCTIILFVLLVLLQGFLFSTPNKLSFSKINWPLFLCDKISHRSLDENIKKNLMSLPNLNVYQMS